MKWFFGLSLFVVAAIAGALPLLFILCVVFGVLYAALWLCRVVFRFLSGVS